MIILALDTDEARNDVMNLRDELGITMPILLNAGGKVSELYHAQGLPTSVLIDASGVIQSVRIGVLDPKWIETYLQTIGIQP